jgi:short-subunit dehydrogenase
LLKIYFIVLGFYTIKKEVGVYWMNLMNKVCVVTGASNGIGFSIVKRLIKSGSKVALLDIDKPALENGNLEHEENNIKYYTCDVSDEKQIVSAVQDIEKNWGTISVWINNAGLARHLPVIEIEENDIDTMMDVNVKGTILGSKHALKSMERNQEGHIINIVSTAGLSGIPNQSVYCASKFAVKGFTEALQKEAAPMGIKVTSIFPGGVNTGFWDKAQEERPSPSLFLHADEITNCIIQVLEMENNCLINSLVVRSINDTDIVVGVV